MNFLSMQKIVDHCKNETLTDKLLLQYISAFIIIDFIFNNSLLDQLPQIHDLKVLFFEDILGLVISLLVLFSAYSLNKKNDGRDFIRRFVGIGGVLYLRFTIITFCIALVYLSFILFFRAMPESISLTFHFCWIPIEILYILRLRFWFGKIGKT